MHAIIQRLNKLEKLFHTNEVAKGNPIMIDETIFKKYFHDEREKETYLDWRHNNAIKQYGTVPILIHMRDSMEGHLEERIREFRNKANKI